VKQDRIRILGIIGILFGCLLTTIGLGVAGCIAGCTATQGATVAQVLADFCPAGVTLLGEPGFAPICASIPEVEAILAGWLGEMNASVAKGAVLPAPHTSADLYHAVLARRAAAAKEGAK
jgi:hypothetical protein